MTRLYPLRSGLLVSAGMFAIAATGAYAQSSAPAAAPAAQTGGLQDIIVTARRVGESAQKTPVAITTFSSNELKYKAIEGLRDLQTNTPSLQIVSNTNNSAGLQISMRGQVQTDVAANAASSVGVYLDDVYEGAASISGGLLNVDDLERVEILKGPQGTLYGRNVTGGLIKFVTRKPTDILEGYITGGLGNYDRHYVSAMINTPIADKVAFRLNGSFDEHSGYSYDPTLKRDLDNRHRWSLRGAVKLDPTERLSILLQGWGGKLHDNGPDARTIYLQPGLNTGSLNLIAAQHINGLSPAALAPLVFGTAGGFTPEQIGAAAAAATAALPAAQQLVDQLYHAGRDKAATNALFPTSNRAHDYGGAFTVAYEIGDATLRSITAYDFGQRTSAFNVGGGPYVPNFTIQTGAVRQITEELQLTGTALDSRLKYAVGFYYLNDRLKDDRTDAGQDGTFPLFLGQFGLGLLNGTTSINRFNVDSKAGYGQASYEIITNVHVTGGLRYTREKEFVRTFQVAQPSIVTGPSVTCAGPSPATASTPLDSCEQRSPTVSYGNLSYTAGVDWDIRPGLLVYAKTSRGFKAGGINGFPGAGSPYIGFRPESNTDYETGVKSQLFDNHLRLNADYYHTDYKDIQRSVVVVVPNNLTTATVNAARAGIDGVEVEAQLIPARGVTLSAQGAYTHAKYKTYDTANPAFPGGIQDISDQPFQGLAKFTYSLTGAYDFDVAAQKVHAEINWSHRSSANLYPNDQHPTTPGGNDFTPANFTTQKAYGLLNGAVSVDIPKYNATLTVWGKNMLNKRYLEAVSGLVNVGLGYTYGSFGAPATVGADLTFRFR